MVACHYHGCYLLHSTYPVGNSVLSTPSFLLRLQLSIPRNYVNIVKKNHTHYNLHQMPILQCQREGGEMDQLIVHLTLMQEHKVCIPSLTSSECCSFVITITIAINLNQVNHRVSTIIHTYIKSHDQNFSSNVTTLSCPCVDTVQSIFKFDIQGDHYWICTGFDSVKKNCCSWSIELRIENVYDRMQSG